MKTELAEVFRQALEAAGGEIVAVSSAAELVAEVAATLASEGERRLLYGGSRVADDAGLAVRLGDEGYEVVAVEAAGADVSDVRVGLTDAAFGIAETGTLVVGGRAGGWGVAAALPRLHLAVLRSPDLVADVPTAVARMRPRFAAGERDWVWITGPSRTADIGKVLVSGVHGPNALRVLLWD